MPYALPIWTLLLWTTRIRNIVADDWTATDLILPIGLTVLAVLALVRRRPGLLVLAAATTAVWIVRLPLVLVHDHPVGFKVVHAVLAIVSIALSIATARRFSRPRVASRA
ncbi:MAG: hypothetical protein JWN67_3564 [Actinomycetia bacterium]|nr:hypothetical protein [Actinomycetes bacterium]